MEWFVKRKYIIKSFRIPTRRDFYVRNLRVHEFELFLNKNASIQISEFLNKNNIAHLATNLVINEDLDQEVIEQLSLTTRNVKILTVSNFENANNNNNWLTVDILSRWKLKELCINGNILNLSLISLIVQTCSDLTIIKLYSVNIDDAAVITITQHCPKIEILLLTSKNITWSSLLALSERGLPLKC